MSKYKHRYRIEDYKESEDTSLDKARIGIYEEDGRIKLVLSGNRVVDYGKMDINTAKKKLLDEARKKDGIIEFYNVDEDFKSSMKEEVNKRWQKHPTSKLGFIISEIVKVADLMDKEGMVDKADKLDKMALQISKLFK